MISIPVAFTIFGLGYMCRTNCEIREKCCKCCFNLEKEDENLDYGNYYYADGERRLDVMEVASDIIFIINLGVQLYFGGRGEDIEYDCLKPKTYRPLTGTLSTKTFGQTVSTTLMTTTTWETMTSNTHCVRPQGRGSSYISPASFLSVPCR